jgi:hypothetical protein
MYDWSSVLDSTDPQQAADAFYASVTSLLDTFYPETSITITSRDPPYLTPTIKKLLRSKNSYMRRGLIDKANALSTRIGSLITKSRAGRLASMDSSPSSVDLWEAVKEITGKAASKATSRPPPIGVNADTLNLHYASTSTDPTYKLPPAKLTCSPNLSVPNEMQVFFALDHLKSTAAGPDLLPYWFLRIAAPFIALPLSHVYQLSLNHSTVPTQWKSASIFPLLKIPQPLGCSDYRPLSLTPILCRVLERLLLRTFIYPLFDQKSNVTSMLSDQYAYRPTGSTTAALISLLSTVSTLLETNPYVHLITFDYSKAFDTVSHFTLMSQVARVNMPDQLYNWIIQFLTLRTHSTKFNSTVSQLAQINAGVVQGSAIGPIAFCLCASTYSPKFPGNHALKYADDMYLIVPSTNTSSIPTELSHVTSWAASNNLRLNQSKSAEIIIKRPRSAVLDPQALKDLPRVSELKVLGITLQSNLHMTTHVNNIVTKAGQAMYALKQVKSHGLPDKLLDTVTRSTLINPMSYASPAWIGFANSEDIGRLQASIKRAYRWGLCCPPAPTYQSLCDAADQKLFKSISSMATHILHPLLPPKQDLIYKLRPRLHPYILPTTSNSLRKNFIHRLLFKICNIKFTDCN